jgi:hypothetical protein
MEMCEKKGELKKSTIKEEKVLQQLCNTSQPPQNSNKLRKKASHILGSRDEQA